MEKKVKVVNIKTGVTKEVTEMMASELIGTKEWEIKEEKKTLISSNKSNLNMNEEENK